MASSSTNCTWVYPNRTFPIVNSPLLLKPGLCNSISSVELNLSYSFMYECNEVDSMSNITYYKYSDLSCGSVESTMAYDHSLFPGYYDCRFDDEENDCLTNVIQLENDGTNCASTDTISGGYYLVADGNSPNCFGIGGSEVYSMKSTCTSNRILQIGYNSSDACSNGINSWEQDFNLTENDCITITCDRDDSAANHNYALTYVIFWLLLLVNTVFIV